MQDDSRKRDRGTPVQLDPSARSLPNGGPLLGEVSRVAVNHAVDSFDTQLTVHGIFRRDGNAGRAPEGNGLLRRGSYFNESTVLNGAAMAIIGGSCNSVV